MKNGFTLIELLIVVLIIGILAAIALPQYMKSVERSRGAAALSIVRTIKDMAEIARMTTGSYPSAPQDLLATIPSDENFSVWLHSDGIYAERRSTPQEGQKYKFIYVYNGYSDPYIAGKLICDTIAKYNYVCEGNGGIYLYDSAPGWRRYAIN